MGAVYYYNIFEGFLWLGFAAVFFVPAVRRGEKHGLFGVRGGLAFVWLSLSEFHEAHTGAWWGVTRAGDCGIMVALERAWRSLGCASAREESPSRTGQGDG